jgi:hypothetical protein
MSGVGQIIPKMQEFVAALASAPTPDDTPFVRNARPFAIYAGIITLLIMGLLSTYFKNEAIALAVIAALSVILQQFGAQRSRDNQARISAATEDKKTITAAASTDKQTAAVAAGGTQ